MKVKFSKIKIGTNWTWILWTVLAIVVIVELILLYLYLYPVSNKKTDETIVDGPNIEVIDFETYKQALDWLDRQNGFDPPDYQLRINDQGQENLFKEYK